MGEYTIGQRAGIQILSGAIRRMIAHDWNAASLMMELRREIYLDAHSAERLNRAYEGEIY